MYKKNLLAADYLVCGGETEVQAEHLKNYVIKMHDFTNSDYVGSVSAVLSITSLPDFQGSLFENRELNVSDLSQNFKNFVASIGPLIYIHKQVERVYQWKNPSVSVLSCFLIHIFFKTNSIFWLFLLGLWLWMIHASVHPWHEKSKKFSEYKENLLFIQEFMGAASKGLDKVKTWKKEVVYWGKPEAAKDFKRKLEFLFIPALLTSFFFTVADILNVLLILSILVSCPLVKLAIVDIFFKFKTIEKTKKSVKLKCYKIYENQRLWLGIWKDFTFPNERNNWSDINGNNLTKESIILQDGYIWEGDWEVEKSPEKEQGWEYAADFTKPFHNKKEFWDYVRRRCWSRSSLLINQ